MRVSSSSNNAKLLRKWAKGCVLNELTWIGFMVAHKHSSHLAADALETSFAASFLFACLVLLLSQEKLLPLRNAASTNSRAEGPATQHLHLLFTPWGFL